MLLNLLRELAATTRLTQTRWTTLTREAGLRHRLMPVMAPLHMHPMTYPRRHH